MEEEEKTTTHASWFWSTRGDAVSEAQAEVIAWWELDNLLTPSRATLQEQNNHSNLGSRRLAS